MDTSYYKNYIKLHYFLSFIYRGVFRPISRGEDYNYLFPFNWFLIGLIGLSIDIFKAPGYFGFIFILSNKY